MTQKQQRLQKKKQDKYNITILTHKPYGNFS